VTCGFVIPKSAKYYPGLTFVLVSLAKTFTKGAGFRMQDAGQ